MLTDTDPRAAAYVNLYAVLGTLPELVRRVPEARELLAADPRPVTVAFVVRGGPRGVLAFRDGAVRVVPDRSVATVVLPFASPAAFNRVVDGTAQPVPVTGLHRAGFLLRVLAPLTALLARYLRPSDEDLADPAFRATSTALALHVAAAAAAQLGNEDRAGRFSAAHVVDGDVALEVDGVLAWTLRARDHRLTFLAEPSPRPRAALTFADLEVAGALLAGRVSALACIGDGRMAMRGTISMVDNVNRILDRVGQYLGE